jgi:GNAT superfamily N-acetyltransferase
MPSFRPGPGSIFRGAILAVGSRYLQYGLAGLGARTWSKTVGSLLDLDVVMTVRASTAQPFVPVPGFRYDRVKANSPCFGDAARLLGVDEAKREGQEAFVTINAIDGQLVACTFNDCSPGAVANQRGVAVAREYRGRGLAVNILQFQATQLSRDGTREIEYHVGLTNRSSRRMFAKLGVQTLDRWVILSLLRRFRFARRLAGTSHGSLKD